MINSKFKKYKVPIMIAAGILMAIGGIIIFDSIWGGLAGALSSLFGFGDKTSEIEAGKVKAEESDARQKEIEKEVIKHKEKVAEHHSNAVKAGTKEHDKPKSAKERENAFKNISNRKPGS